MNQIACQGESFVVTDSPVRRRWLLATAGLGGALALTAAVPFVASLLPSERAKAAGAPVDVDIGTLAPRGVKQRTNDFKALLRNIPIIVRDYLRLVLLTACGQGHWWQVNNPHPFWLTGMDFLHEHRLEIEDVRDMPAFASKCHLCAWLER